MTRSLTRFQNASVAALLYWGACWGVSAQTLPASPPSSPPASASASAEPQPLPPLTAAGRFRWFAFATGRSMVAGSLFSAAWGEMVKSPPEYARTLEGFGLRYRNSLAGVTMQNAIEASLGAAWGEDPRYLPYSTGLRDWKAKAAHSIKYTFLALRRDGRPMPAYSRYIGISVSNVISNQWRPPSETDAAGTLLRFAYGFAGRLTSNAVREFVPPVIRALRKKKPVDPVSATPPTASTVHVPPEH